MNSKRGMALVTVMVALAVLAVALVMATSAFMSASKLTKHAACVSAASNFAEGVMERTRSQPFDSIRSERISAGLPHLPGAACEVTVTKPEPGLKQVVVTCSWVEGSRTRSVRFSTLVAGGAR